MKGFTLIEIIIYLSIFALMSGSIVSYVLLMSEINQKRQAMAEVLYASERINSYLEMELQNSSGLNSPTFQNNSHKVIFNNPSGQIEVECIDYVLTASDSVESFFLTPPQVKCKNFRVSNISQEALAIKYNVDLYSEGDSSEFVYEINQGTSLIKL